MRVTSVIMASRGRQIPSCSNSQQQKTAFSFLLIPTSSPFWLYAARLKPSLVLLRTSRYSPDEQARVLRSVVDVTTLALEEGAVVVIEPARVRIRRLPIVE